jgi:hypothetical protein
MHKVGARWVGHSDGDAKQCPPPPASLLYTVANKEMEEQFLEEGCDIVVLGNKRNM